MERNQAQRDLREPTRYRTSPAPQHPAASTVVLTIVLIVFGPGKLPELGRAVGDSLRELRRSTVGEPDTSTAPLASTHTASGPSCPDCRTPLLATDRFCGTCGAPIAATSAAR